MIKCFFIFNWFNQTFSVISTDPFYVESVWVERNSQQWFKKFPTVWYEAEIRTIRKSFHKKTDSIRCSRTSYNSPSASSHSLMSCHYQPINLKTWCSYFTISLLNPYINICAHRNTNINKQPNKYKWMLQKMHPSWISHHYIPVIIHCTHINVHIWHWCKMHVLNRVQAKSNKPFDPRAEPLCPTLERCLPSLTNWISDSSKSSLKIFPEFPQPAVCQSAFH